MTKDCKIVFFELHSRICLIAGFHSAFTSCLDYTIANTAVDHYCEAHSHQNDISNVQENVGRCYSSSSHHPFPAPRNSHPHQVTLNFVLLRLSQLREIVIVTVPTARFHTVPRPASKSKPRQQKLVTKKYLLLGKHGHKEIPRLNLILSLEIWIHQETSNNTFHEPRCL